VSNSVGSVCRSEGDKPTAAECCDYCERSLGLHSPHEALGVTGLLAASSLTKLPPERGRTDRLIVSRSRRPGAAMA
jgi:hypothetical protein